MAIQFNSANHNSHVTWPLSSRIDMAVNQPFSMACWFYPYAGTTFQNIWVMTDASTDDMNGIAIDANENLKIVTDGQTPANGSGLTMEQWYQAVLTWDGTQYEIFLDGISDYSVVPNSTSFIPFLDQLTTGLRPFDSINDYQGSAAELAVWKRQLTQAEISHLAQGNSPDTLETDLIFYAPCFNNYEDKFGAIPTVGAANGNPTFGPHPPFLKQQLPGKVITLPSDVGRTKRLSVPFPMNSILARSQTRLRIAWGGNPAATSDWANTALIRDRLRAWGHIVDEFDTSSPALEFRPEHGYDVAVCCVSGNSADNANRDWADPTSNIPIFCLEGSNVDELGVSVQTNATAAWQSVPYSTKWAKWGIPPVTMTGAAGDGGLSRLLPGGDKHPNLEMLAGLTDTGVNTPQIALLEKHLFDRDADVTPVAHNCRIAVWPYTVANGIANWPIANFKAFEAICYWLAEKDELKEPLIVQPARTEFNRPMPLPRELQPVANYQLGEIDWANPLAAEARVIINHGYADRNLVDGELLTRQNDAVVLPDRNNKGLFIKNRSSREGLQFANSLSGVIDWSADLTVFHFARFDYGTLSDADEFTLLCHPDPTGSDLLNLNSASTLPEGGEPFTVGFTMRADAGTEARACVSYENGIVVGTGTRSVGSPDGLILRYDNTVNQWEHYVFSGTLTDVSTIGMHANTGKTADNWDGAIYLTVIFQRVLSRGEMLSLHRDPWQLLRPAVPLPHYTPGPARVVEEVTETPTPNERVVYPLPKQLAPRNRKHLRITMYSALAGTNDLAYIDTLRQLGHTVTQRNGNSVAIAEETADVVIISESVASSNMASKFLDSKIPLLIHEIGNVDDHGLGGGQLVAGNIGFGLFPGPDEPPPELKFTLGDHRTAGTAEGFNSSFNGADVRVLYTDSNGRPVVWTAERGANMQTAVSSETFPARRAVWLMREEATDALTRPGADMIDKLLHWLVDDDPIIPMAQASAKLDANNPRKALPLLDALSPKIVTSKPTVPYAIDRNNKFGKYAAFATVFDRPGVAHDLVTGKYGELISTAPTAVSTKEGIAARGNAAGYWTWGTDYANVWGGKERVSTVVRIYDLGAFDGQICGNVQNWFSFALTISHSAQKVEATFQNDAGTLTSPQYPAGTPSAGDLDFLHNRWTTLVATYDGVNSTLRLVCDDGTSYNNSEALTGALRSTPTPGPLSVFSRGDNQDPLDANGHVAFVAVFDEVFSQQDAEEIHRRPYQFIKGGMAPLIALNGKAPNKATYPQVVLDSLNQPKLIKNIDEWEIDWTHPLTRDLRHAFFPSLGKILRGDSAYPTAAGSDGPSTPAWCIEDLARSNAVWGNRFDIEDRRADAVPRDGQVFMRAQSGNYTTFPLFDGIGPTQIYSIAKANNEPWTCLSLHGLDVTRGAQLTNKITCWGGTAAASHKGFIWNRRGEYVRLYDSAGTVEVELTSFTNNSTDRTVTTIGKSDGGGVAGGTFTAYQIETREKQVSSATLTIDVETDSICSGDSQHDDGALLWGPHLFWDRELTDEECWEIGRNPYQILKRKTPKNYITGDNPQTITLTPGSPLNLTNVSPAQVKDGQIGVILTGTGFGATQGSSSVTINGVTQTISSWSDTSITLGALDLTGVPLGDGLVIVNVV